MKPRRLSRCNASDRNNYKPWFAWHPVRTPSGWRWWSYVKRRRVQCGGYWVPLAWGYFDYKEVFRWEYR